MTYEQEHTTIQRDLRPAGSPADGAQDKQGAPAQVVEQRDRVVYRPSGSTIAARIVATVFGVVQALLIARIALEGLGALRSNEIVAAVLDVTRPVVDPFQGMFRVNTIGTGASVLDTAAITALIGLTLVEVLLLGIVRIPRRTEDV